MFSSSYNVNNIFAKILKKEIKANILFENEIILIIKDINPIDTTHLLIIPKFEVSNFTELINHEKNNYYWESVKIFINQTNIKDYYIRSNNGPQSGQIIYHAHLHFISKEICDLYSKNPNIKTKEKIKEI